MNTPPRSCRRAPRLHHETALSSQLGVMLIEVLIAILLFTIGALGLVGLHAASIRESHQAQMRAEATLAAEELIGTMWSSNRTFANLRDTFQSPRGQTPAGQGFTDWKTRLEGRLPGVGANPPTVTMTQITSTAPATVTATRVTITVRWLAPSEQSATPHTMTVTNEIPG